MPETSKLDRILHVALTVPSKLLGKSGSAEITHFFEELFGWQTHPSLCLDGKVLVMGADVYEPLLFLHAAKEPMHTTGHDHFALGVNSVAELQQVIAKAETFAKNDERAKVSKYTMQDYGVAKLHSFFVRFLLPLKVEVQYLETLSQSD